MRSPASPVRSRAVWIGLLGGPAAWVLEMLLVFFASRACIGRTTILIVGTIVAALIAVASGAVAWRLARQVEQLPAESPVVAERLGFYANGGVYVSGLSVLVILMVLVTAIILGSSCR